VSPREHQHRAEHLDLCAAQALGVLDAAGRAELEAHLATGCEECRAELRALAGGTTVLAMSAPPLRAPAALRERVLAAAVRQPAAVVIRPEFRWRPVVWGLAAAAALLAVAGVFAWQRAVTLDRALAAARARAIELERTLETERAWAGLPTAPGTRIVQLAVTPDGDSTLAARVIYHAASRRAMVVGERLVPPAGRAYELWAITASGPASLGVVAPDRQGHVVARLEQVGGDEPIAAFAFSLEGPGGSPDKKKPSGPVVLVGHIGG
jgi:anti-sigma-K factor RskA